MMVFSLLSFLFCFLSLLSFLLSFLSFLSCLSFFDFFFSFLFLNTLESQLITPTVLGRSMRMNPLVIMVWLMVWGWLWGIAGVLIAVPLLVCIKLILSRSGEFDPWLKLIESRT